MQILKKYYLQFKEYFILKFVKKKKIFQNNLRQWFWVSTSYIYVEHIGITVYCTSLQLSGDSLLILKADFIYKEFSEQCDILSSVKTVKSGDGGRPLLEDWFNLAASFSLIGR